MIQVLGTHLRSSCCIAADPSPPLPACPFLSGCNFLHAPYHIVTWRGAVPVLKSANVIALVCIAAGAWSQLSSRHWTDVCNFLCDDKAGRSELQ